MEPLTINERYGLFIDTLTKCCSQVMSLSDEELEYNLFEDCAVEICSYFHESNLSDLRDAGFIDADCESLAKALRHKWNSLEQTDWTAKSVRTSPEWRRRFEMSDRILQHQSRNRQ
jgi:hypothetical protein